MRYRRDDNLLNEMMTPGMVVVQAVEEEPPSKITKAADYLSSVYHWLDYEHTKEMGGDSMYNMGHESLKGCGCPEGEECPHD